MAGSDNARQAASAAASARTSGPAVDSTPDAGGHFGEDRMTVLTTFGPLATKVLGPGPDDRPAVLEASGGAGRFRATPACVWGLAELRGLPEPLATRRRSFVIRGELLPGADPWRCKRLLHPKREDDGTV